MTERRVCGYSAEGGANCRLRWGNLFNCAPGAVGWPSTSKRPTATKLKNRVPSNRSLKVNYGRAWRVTNNNTMVVHRIIVIASLTKRASFITRQFADGSWPNLF
jgi:hypothetical protein